MPKYWLLLATAACLSAQPDLLGIGPRPDPAAVERGKSLFTANCGFCHGANARGGDTGPDLVRSLVVLHDQKGNLVGPVILNGVPDKGMPKFTFTKGQLADVVAFLRSRVQAAIDRDNYRLLNIVTGDAKAGEQYFKGAGKCNACHSPTGDLAGIAKKLSPVDLQTRFLYPGEANQVIVTLPSGQSFSGTLQFLDDFNVAMWDSSGAYHNWPRQGGIKVDLPDPGGSAHLELLKKYTDADMHNVLAYLETLK